MNIFVRFVAVLMTMLSLQYSVPVNESNIGEYLAPDADSVANYIEENLALFVEEYNATLDEDETPFAASFVEFRRIVILTSDYSIAVFLDFDGDNGYMLIANDYEVLELEVTGDLEYMRTDEIIFYSIYDRFCYVNEDLDLVPYGIRFGDEEFWNSVDLSKIYDGQSAAGESTIYSPDFYIANRYGSGFICDESRLLARYKTVTQNDFNSYWKDGHGEGNCVLSSMYGLLCYWRDNLGFSNLPKTKSLYNPNKDSFYSSVISKGWTPDTREIPDLYQYIRKMAIEKDKYTVDGFSTNKISSTIEATAKNWGYTNIEGNIYYVYSFESQVVKEINAGYPTIWNTAGGYYGKHSTVCAGYRTYLKTTKVLFVTVKTYKHLMWINDNWNSSNVYFDYSAYSDSFLGFSSFVRVR